MFTVYANRCRRIVMRWIEYRRQQNEIISAWRQFVKLECRIQFRRSEKPKKLRPPAISGPYARENLANESHSFLAQNRDQVVKIISISKTEGVWSLAAVLVPDQMVDVEVRYLEICEANLGGNELSRYTRAFNLVSSRCTTCPILFHRSTKVFSAT